MKIIAGPWRDIIDSVMLLADKANCGDEQSQCHNHNVNHWNAKRTSAISKCKSDNYVKLGEWQESPVNGFVELRLKGNNAIWEGFQGRGIRQWYKSPQITLYASGPIRGEPTNMILIGRCCSPVLVQKRVVNKLLECRKDNRQFFG